jgi:DNA-binding NarL/FixJ family response regulator
MPEADLLTTMVIEDRPDTREALRILIAGTAGYRCVGAFGAMEEALARLPVEPPKAVLVDIGLPGMSGIEGIRMLRQLYPKAALLALTVYEDSERIFSALCAGATGYLLKRTAPARLLESIREAVVDGGAPMSPEVARKVVTFFREGRPSTHVDYKLTPHQVRVLKLIAEGHNYPTAARELGVTVDAVSFHMKRIYEKLHVHSKSQAVAKAFREGIVH